MSSFGFPWMTEIWSGIQGLRNSRLFADKGPTTSRITSTSVVLSDRL
jgi:hypothetical protein